MTSSGDTSQPTQGAPLADQGSPDPDTRPATAADAAPAAASEETQDPEGLLAEQVEEAAHREEVADRNLRFTDSYGLVLALLAATFFVTAIGGEHTWGRIASLVVLATTTWLALRASRVQRVVLRWAMALIPVVTVVAVVAVVLGSEDTGRGIGAALTVLLVVVAPVAIVRRLASHLVVSLNTFYGAVCVYLLIAMFFASTYALTSWVQGVPFFAQVEPPAHATTVDYLYFSFITITTVGYGDLTAAGSVGRMTAACEAVFGQLYLITVVALVVQNLGQERRYRSIRQRLKK